MVSVHESSCELQLICYTLWYIHIYICVCVHNFCITSLKYFTPILLISSEVIPDETVALSLAAPAIAVANIAAHQPIAHTAPLLPTPPSLLNLASGMSVLGNPPVSTAAALTAAMPGLAGIAPAMVSDFLVAFLCCVY